jgi:hypothetical protein
MRYEIKGKLCKTHTTFSEFVEMSNREGLVYKSSDVRSSPRDSFYGNIKSYQDMYDACYNGMGVKKMLKARADLNNLINHEVEEPRKAIVGETLNVGAYCAGNPYHFYKDADEYGKPRVHIVYSTNAMSDVKSAQFTRHGASICALVDQLGEQVDVKISLYISNKWVLSGNGCQIVTIKDYEDVVDVPRVSATAHPSFFRRIGFAWFENADKLIQKGLGTGVGGSYTGSDRHHVIKDDEFMDWIGIEKGEMMIDFPAPDEYQFKSDEYTAKWLKQATKKIEEAIEEGSDICKLFGL